MTAPSRLRRPPRTASGITVTTWGSGRRALGLRNVSYGGGGNRTRERFQPAWRSGNVLDGLRSFSAHSSRLLMAAMIVDAHTDVLLELLVRDGAEPSFELVLRRGEAGVFRGYWLPRLAEGGVGVQICPLYGEGARRSDARERTLAQEAEFRRIVEENAEQACQLHTSAELHDPRLRLMLSMEGVEPLEGDPAAFEEWYERGVRTASLTWNQANEFAGGIETPTQGLTDRGRALVRRFTNSASSSTLHTHPSKPGTTSSKKGSPSQ